MPRPSLPARVRASRGAARGIPHTRLCVRSVAPALLAGAALALAGCGSIAEAPEEPAAKPVQLSVQSVRFSERTQDPGQAVTLTMRVANTGPNPVEHLVITLSGIGQTRLAPADLIEELPEDYPEQLPDTIEQPAWTVDEAPGRYALAAGDQYDAGRLAAGEETTVEWTLGALTSGDHTLQYRVTAGLTDNAAEATTGNGLTGQISATIREYEPSQ